MGECKLCMTVWQLNPDMIRRRNWWTWREAGGRAGGGERRGQIGMGNLIEAAILGRYKREEGEKRERIGEARFCEVAKSGKDHENGNFKRV